MTRFKRRALLRLSSTGTYFFQAALTGSEAPAASCCAAAHDKTNIREKKKDLIQTRSWKGLLRHDVKLLVRSGPLPFQ